MAGEYVRRLRRIRYLANVCVVLELDRSLSDLYWLNVIHGQAWIATRS